MRNLATVFSAELEGIQARIIEVEVDLNAGLHSFTIVGLADRALHEAKERVNSALKNSGAKPPNRENRKITINLAPADIRKTGSQYDLAIALGYLVATRQIARFNAEDKMFLGELALDGRLRPISGALNIAEMAAAKGFEILFLPRENADEASVISGLRVVPADNLADILKILEGKTPIVAHRANIKQSKTQKCSPDFSQMKKLDAQGVIITARGNDVDFVSRFFAPNAGIDEDPVTGSAHCLLVPYWSEKLGKNEFTARQVSARGGFLQCKLLGDRVEMSGKAVTYLKGEIDIAE